MTIENAPTRTAARRTLSTLTVITLLALVAPMAKATTWAKTEPNAPASVGGGFELSWWKLAGGGGHSSGGDFTVTGTIGQHDVDSAHPASGGELTLIGGFWVAFSGADEPLPDFLFRDRFEVEVD